MTVVSAREIAFERSANLPVGLSLRQALVDIIAGVLVVDHPVHGNHVEYPIELAIPSTIELVSDGGARGCG